MNEVTNIYEVIEMLGYGSFGDVFLVRDKKDFKKYQNHTK